MARRGGGGEGVDVPISIGDARTVAQIQEVYKSLSDLERSMLAVEAASPDVKAEIDRLTRAFAAGEVTTEDLRLSLRRLAGDVPKSAAELRKLDRAAESAGKGVSGAAQATSAAGESADRAAPKIRAAADAVGRAGDTATGARNGLGALALDFNQITGAAGTARDAIAAAIHATAEADRAQDAIRLLGSGWAEVQRQTNGTVTAQRAAAAQQQITRSGLRLSGEELGRITRFTREYAIATGTEATQQLERFADALAGGSADALQEFGLRVTEGASRARLMEQALAGIERQQRGQAPVARTFAEDTTRLAEAFTGATSALALMASEGLGLQSVISGLGDELQSLVGDLQDVIRIRREASQGAQALAARQSASDAYLATVRQTRERLMASGMARDEVERLAPRANINRLSVEQITAATNRLRQSVDVSQTGMDARRTTVTQAASVRRVGDLDRFGDLFGAGDTRATVEPAALRAAYDRARGSDRERLSRALVEVGAQMGRDLAANDNATRRRLATRPRDLNRVGADGSQASAAEIAEGRLALQQARLGAFGAGLGDRLGLGSAALDSADVTAQDARIEALRRRAMDTGARGQENEAQRLTRVAGAIREYVEAVQERAAAERTLNDALQAGALAQKDRDDALSTQLREAQRAALDTRQQGVERRFQEREQQAQLRTARTGDEQRPGERLTELQEQHAALQALIDVTNERLTRLQAEGAAQSEVNAELQRRIGLTTSMIAVDREASAIERERTSATRAWRDGMTSSLGSVAEAFGAATEAAIEGTDSFEAALQQQLRAVLVTLAKQSVVEVLKNLGMAAYNAAVGNVPAATNHLAAAGLWGAAGVAAGVGAAAIPQKREAATAAPPTSSTQGRASQLPSRVQAPSEGPLTIQINVNGALMNEGVEESVVRALDRAGMRGLRPRLLASGTGARR